MGELPSGFQVPSAPVGVDWLLDAESVPKGMEECPVCRTGTMKSEWESPRDGARYVYVNCGRKKEDGGSCGSYSFPQMGGDARWTSAEEKARKKAEREKEKRGGAPKPVDETDMPTAYDSLLGTQVLEAVKKERDRQTKKWGDQHHTDDQWKAILEEELAEAWTKMMFRQAAVPELIQAAAVIVAWSQDRIRSNEEERGEAGKQPGDPF